MPCPGSVAGLQREQVLFGGQPTGIPRESVGGRYAGESYLNRHADKLATRFDANAYVVFTESMDSHDVGRVRGGVQAALERVTAYLVVMGVDSDRSIRSGCPTRSRRPAPAQAPLTSSPRTMVTTVSSSSSARSARSFAKHSRTRGR